MRVRDCFAHAGQSLYGAQVTAMWRRGEDAGQIRPAVSPLLYRQSYWRYAHAAAYRHFPFRVLLQTLVIL